LVLKVLAVLPEPGQQPVSTTAVRHQFGDLDVYERENYVLAALNRIAAAGWADKTHPAGEMRVFWRLTPAGVDGRRRRMLPPAVEAHRAGKPVVYRQVR
jgi:hypothetical protein